MRSSYFEPGEKSCLADRLKILLAIISVLFFILVLNLGFIQIIRGAYYRKVSRENSLRLVRDEAHRGRILDRHKNSIVENKALLNLFFIPHDLVESNEIIDFLSSIISFPSDELRKQFKKRGGSPFEGVLIKKSLSVEETVKISEQNFRFPGIYIKEGICRSYPEKRLASHVVGYVDHSGLELEYNQYLKGINGVKEIEVDAKGNLHRILRERKSKPGVDIILNIDISLQKKAEELLRNKSGVIICLDPRNGEVLTMASSPDYAPSIFAEKKSKEIKALIKNRGSPLLNRAVQGRYPPGSVFKVITAGAFLEEKFGNQNTTFTCSGTMEMGRTFSCWKKDGHGRINLLEAMAYSCDVYFYNLGLKTGIDCLSRYALGCGLGKKTGIELPYEKKGFVPTRSWKKNFFRIFSQKRWYPGETMVTAIGQGYLTVTPLEVASLYAAIANGGRIYKPHLIRAMEREGREISISEADLRGRLPFKQKTLNIIKKSLYEVVQGHGEKDGTGAEAKMDRVKAAGKTGTAQVVGIKRFEDKEIPLRFRDHAWFCGFAPYEAPRIVTVVLIEHGGSGANVAAPLFKELMEFYFDKIKKL
ncbi:MAG: penicillin-binding protein 2 [Candidatus Omnitrophica bacterium]|nr:penicillin-binding protein 2 [Candidatus Omnitrophota bacterium]